MEILYVPLHLIALTYAAWNIVHADHMGLMWMRGKIQKLDSKLVTKYHKGTWIGLIFAILTGTLAFFSARPFIVYPQFYIKMTFVAILIINSFVIGNLSKIPSEKTFLSLSTREKTPLFISGGLSTISWIGAAIMALFIAAE
jgi:hypothetical protein